MLEDKSKKSIAITTARTNCTGNEKISQAYARKSGGDGVNAGVLNPKKIL
jgi:hypothetical protein